VSLDRVRIGCVPIVWNNVDVPDLAPLAPHEEILDTFARLAYEGTQFGRGFPEGDELIAQLRPRDLRLAELYSAMPSGPAGLEPGGEELVRADLARLVAADGDVLVVALHGTEACEPVAGRLANEPPRWSDRAFDELAGVLSRLVEAAPTGVRVAFHPHTATWIESPSEVEALAERLPSTGAGLCLDVGHYLVGGGDPVAALRRHGSLVTHVHAKDVDPAVLGRLRAGELAGFGAAVRERLFTELGNGALDIAGVVAELDRIDFDGWVMVEQDSTWLAPAEAAAIGGRVLRYAMREHGR
jgi:inosose dehydratase